MILAIDFDRTLCDTDNPPPGKKLGPPLPGAVEAVTKLCAAGYKILIHSCRANDGPRSIKVVTDWLNYFKIPFDYIWGEAQTFPDIGKPICDFYIDDKAIEFKNNWDEIAERLLDVR